MRNSTLLVELDLILLNVPLIFCLCLSAIWKKKNIISCHDQTDKLWLACATECVNKQLDFIHNNPQHIFLVQLNSLNDSPDYFIAFINSFRYIQTSISLPISSFTTFSDQIRFKFDNVDEMKQYFKPSNRNQCSNASEVVVSLWNVRKFCI